MSFRWMTRPDASESRSEDVQAVAATTTEEGDVRPTHPHLEAKACTVGTAVGAAPTEDSGQALEKYQRVADAKRARS